MSDVSSNHESKIGRSKGVPQWLYAPLSVLAVVIIFFSAQIIGSLVVSIYPALHHWSDATSTDWLNNSVTAQFFYGLIADGLLVAGVAYMLKLFHWKWSYIGLKTPKIRHLAYGVMAVVPYYILYIIAVELVSKAIPGFNTNEQQQIGFNSVHGSLDMVLTFLSLVIIPPLAEEITMRGFLYSGLKKWLPKIVAGLVVSVLFGAAHLMEGGSAGPLWIGAIDTFTLSLVLVYLREKTGNLWAGITLHAVKNGIAFAVLFIIGNR